MAPWDWVHIRHLVPSRPSQLSQHWEGETLLVLVSCHHGHNHDDDQSSSLSLLFNLNTCTCPFEWSSAWTLLHARFIITSVFVTMIIFMIIPIIRIIIIAEPPLPQLPLTLLQLRRTSLTPCRPTSDPPQIYWNRKFLFFQSRTKWVFQQRSRLKFIGNGCKIQCHPISQTWKLFKESVSLKKIRRNSLFLP